MAEFSISFPDNQFIVMFHNDGKVEFSSHLTPKEGSEEAWRLLVATADRHNKRIAVLDAASKIEALEREVKAWRKRFPVAGFDGNSIVLSG